MNYLELCNAVLLELNEVELTNTNFATSRGVQSATKEFVNKAISDLYNAEVEWAWLHTSNTQDTIVGQREYTLPTDMRKVDFESFYLTPKQVISNNEYTSDISNWVTVSGSPSYSSLGNGRLLLNNSEVTQAVTVTTNRQYKIAVRVLGGTVKLKVGTSSGDSSILDKDISVTNVGDGKVFSATFTPTTSTINIGFANTTVANHFVDFVKLAEDFEACKLRYISYDDFLREYTNRDFDVDTKYRKPERIYRTQNHTSFGLTPVPDKDTYTINYEYFKTHTDLSAATDEPLLPARYHRIVVNRAKYYLYKLRSDVPMANIANAEYEDGVKRIRIEMLNKPDYVRDLRVNLNTISSGGLTTV
jgi:hypothetical protein